MTDVTTPAYCMITTEGDVFTLASNGAVLARSNGPKGHTYSGKWIILGVVTRYNSYECLRLSEVADGAPFGQGWIRDSDHGTVRYWGPNRLRSLVRIT